MSSTQSDLCTRAPPPSPPSSLCGASARNRRDLPRIRCRLSKFKALFTKAGALNTTTPHSLRPTVWRRKATARQPRTNLLVRRVHRPRRPRYGYVTGAQEGSELFRQPWKTVRGTGGGRSTVMGGSTGGWVQKGLAPDGEELRKVLAVETFWKGIATSECFFKEIIKLDLLMPLEVLIARRDKTIPNVTAQLKLLIA
ncbi:hypothetical protein GEV33_014827 [Tenebrio molitor]|uniref:Uncharacterized protein n=1 Tax=Tenebrio molitor TaxID=7067 RepID=A0A8J6H4F9_TENMO|nr:hypothetical protein GEV33_014832 [Tenebrio molitor]KAH0807964.1 hypothetical protein GEV33_014827 [Tenebrio molitor]